MRSWISNYLQRHQHPACLALHIVGVPLTVAAVVLAVWQLEQWRWDLWYRPMLLLAVGYLLQWIGHRIEGNDLGEVVLIKKLLGRPYKAISPRHEAAPESDRCDP